jgi:hypothetical protein
MEDNELRTLSSSPTFVHGTPPHSLDEKDWREKKDRLEMPEWI